MKNGTFEELNIAIGTESGPWHDPNREYAWKLVERLSDDAWGDLLKTIIGKPAYWQERCADALGGVTGTESLRALKVLLLHGSFSAAALAANALADDDVGLPHEYEARLRALRSALPPFSPTLSDVDKLIDLIGND